MLLSTAIWCCNSFILYFMTYLTEHNEPSVFFCFVLFCLANCLFSLKNKQTNKNNADVWLTAGLDASKSDLLITGRKKWIWQLTIPQARSMTVVSPMKLEMSGVMGFAVNAGLWNKSSTSEKSLSSFYRMFIYQQISDQISAPLLPYDEE